MHAIRGTWARSLWRNTCFLGGALLLLAGCAGGSRKDKYYVPDDLPEICQSIDFSRTRDKALLEMCGVKTRNYMAYRNVPEHRSLIVPKGGKIVRKGSRVELRLPDFLPVSVPGSIGKGLDFGEAVRRKPLASEMQYFEYFPGDAERPVRLMKLALPLDRGEPQELCFSVENPLETQQRMVGYAKRLVELPCRDFNVIQARETTGP